MNAIGVMLDSMELNRHADSRYAGRNCEATQSRRCSRDGGQPPAAVPHIAWQLTHVGITEELTSTERINGTSPAFARPGSSL